MHLFEENEGATGRENERVCVRDSGRGGTMEGKVREILEEFGETFTRRRQCDDG